MTDRKDQRDALAHPMQPVGFDAHGVARFKRNAIVEYLLDRGPFDMNHLAALPFSAEDRMQFAQLIGYSVCGYGELHYVTDESYDAAMTSSGAVLRIKDETDQSGAYLMTIDHHEPDETIYGGIDEAFVFPSGDAAQWWLRGRAERQRNPWPEYEIVPARRAVEKST